MLQKERIKIRGIHCFVPRLATGNSVSLFLIGCYTVPLIPKVGENTLLCTVRYENGMRSLPSHISVVGWQRIHVVHTTTSCRHNNIFEDNTGTATVLSFQPSPTRKRKGKFYVTFITSASLYFVLIFLITISNMMMILRRASFSKSATK